MSCAELNALDESAAQDRFLRCCVSRRWVDGMVQQRPYADAEQLREHARRQWQSLDERDWLEAFEGHPKIGDVNSLRAKYASSGDLAADEQSGVASASDDVIQRLARGNAEYEERFGFIFIVCATGRTADDLCAMLEERLDNDRNTELAIAADEQLKILLLRLEQLL